MFELLLIKESLEQEVERTKGWDRSWNNGRVEGMQYAIGLIDIALSNTAQEVKDENNENRFEHA